VSEKTTRTLFSCDSLKLFRAVDRALQATPPNKAGYLVAEYKDRAFRYSLATNAKPSTVAKLIEDADIDTANEIYAISHPDETTFDALSTL
jgi:hypothetical protein